MREDTVPTYQYACTDCGERTEVVQKFTDDALSVCVACGGKLRKVFSPVGIVFKGSGFYRTDSRNSSVAAAGPGNKDSASKDGASNGSSSSSESKGSSNGDSSGSGGSSKSSDSGSSSGSGSSGDKKSSTAASSSSSGSSSSSSSSGSKVA
jgi:putative FmdB family regulatory protein